MKFNVLSIRGVLAILLVLSTGCMRKHAVTPADNAPVGYVSESTCLKLISGQEYKRSSVSPEIIKTEVRYASCAESCECNCSSVASTPKKSNVALQSKTQSSKPVQSAKTTVAKPKEVVAKESTVVKTKDSTARASLNVKSVSSSFVQKEEVVPADANIKKVQEALNKKGAKLEVDGHMGERTVRLLKAFQTMNDLPVTGKADEATAKALGVK